MTGGEQKLDEYDEHDGNCIQDFVSIRCYVYLTIATLILIFLWLPSVEAIFKDWIPNDYYRLFTKALIFLALLFLLCQLMLRVGYCPCDELDNTGEASDEITKLLNGN